jgi:hypothetical protein
MGIIFPRSLAYGSLYNPSPDFIDIESRIENQKVDFTTNGPLSGTSADLLNDELVVLTGGVYEISTDVTVLSQALGFSGPSNAIFRLFINENTPVPESEFESFFNIVEEDVIILETRITIGKTIQLQLEANDRLSVRIVFVSPGRDLQYRQPSLTVTKLDD